MKNVMVIQGTVTNLWRKKFTFSKGWVWELARECDINLANDWLEVFKKSEPEFEFKLSVKKPKI